MRKRYLRRNYGAGTVEDLALAMYDVFHGTYKPDPYTTGWTPFKKYKGDQIIESMRLAAHADACDAYYDAVERGIGSAFDWSSWEKEDE